MKQSAVQPSSVVIFKNPLMDFKPRPTIVMDSPDDKDGTQLVVSFSSQLLDYSFQEYFPSNGDTGFRHKSCLVLPCYGYASSKTLSSCRQLLAWNSTKTLPYWEQALFEWDQFVSDLDRKSDDRYITPKSSDRVFRSMRRHKRLMSIPNSIRILDDLTQDVVNGFLNS